MERRFIRRSLAIALMVGLTGLAACAQPTPPPAVEAPPPAPPMPPPAPPAPPPPMPAHVAHWVTTARANLRARPRGRIIAVLPRGTPVRPIGPGLRFWVHVHTPKGNGWVFRRFVARH